MQQFSGDATMLNFLVGLLLLFSGTSNVFTGYHPWEWLKRNLPTGLPIRTLREKLEKIKEETLQARIDRKHETQAKLEQHVRDARSILKYLNPADKFEWKITDLTLPEGSVFSDHEKVIISRNQGSGQETIDDLLKYFILNPNNQLFNNKKNEGDGIGDFTDYSQSLIIPNNVVELIKSIARLISFYQSQTDLESRNLMQTLHNLQAFIYCLIPTDNKDLRQKIYNGSSPDHIIRHEQFMSDVGLKNEMVFIFIQEKLSEYLNNVNQLNLTNNNYYANELMRAVDKFMKAVVRPVPDPKLWQNEMFKNINYYLILMQQVFGSNSLEELATTDNSQSFNDQIPNLNAFKQMISDIVGSSTLLPIQHDFIDLFKKMEQQKLPLFENLNKIFTTISQQGSDISGSSVVENLWKKPNALSFEINGIISERKLIFNQEAERPDERIISEIEKTKKELERLIKYSFKREQRVSNGNRRASRMVPWTRQNVRNIKRDEDDSSFTFGLADLSTYECTDLGFEMAYLILLKHTIVNYNILVNFPSARQMLLDYISYRQVYCLFKTNTNSNSKLARATLEAIIKHYDIEQDLVLAAAAIALNNPELTQEVLSETKTQRQVEPPANKKTEFKIVSALEMARANFNQRKELAQEEELGRKDIKDEEDIFRELMRAQAREDVRKEDAWYRGPSEEVPARSMFPALRVEQLLSDSYKDYLGSSPTTPKSEQSFFPSQSSTSSPSLEELEPRIERGLGRRALGITQTAPQTP